MILQEAGPKLRYLPKGMIVVMVGKIHSTQHLPALLGTWEVWILNEWNSRDILLPLQRRKKKKQRQESAYTDLSFNTNVSLAAITFQFSPCRREYFCQGHATNKSFLFQQGLGKPTVIRTVCKLGLPSKEWILISNDPLPLFLFLLLFLTSKRFANFLYFKDIIKNADYIDIILNTKECEQECTHCFLNIFVLSSINKHN